VIIGVTGLNTASKPAAGYGVLKALQDSGGHELVGLAYGPLETGLYQSGLLKKAHLIPFPDKEGKAFLQRLAQIKAKDGLDLLIPNLPEEIPLLIDQAAALEALGIQTLLPSQRAMGHISRQGLPGVMKKQAASFRISMSDGREEKIDLPSLGKAPVQNIHTLASITDDAFSIALLAGRSGRVVGVASVKKLLASAGGSTWMALTVEDRRLTALADAMAAKTGWRGPMTINLARNQNGEMRRIEVHPVFPDWINLAAAAGANLPALLVDLARGKRIPHRVKAVPGRLLVRTAIDLVTDIERFGRFSLEGELTYEGK
jgi:hypothetical protein